VQRERPSRPAANDVYGIFAAQLWKRPAKLIVQNELNRFAVEPAISGLIARFRLIGITWIGLTLLQLGKRIMEM
jgi:hypothetical protein